MRKTIKTNIERSESANFCDFCGEKLIERVFRFCMDDFYENGIKCSICKKDACKKCSGDINRYMDEYSDGQWKPSMLCLCKDCVAQNKDLESIIKEINNLEEEYLSVRDKRADKMKYFHQLVKNRRDKNV